MSGLPQDDEDELLAAVELVGRCGARNFETGYVHDDVPIADAGWYAHAQFKGVRIIEEDHASPIDAVYALAVRLLAGAMCNHCKGLIALTPDGAFAFEHAHLLDGTPWNVEQVADLPQCHWKRVGQHWVRGCEDQPPEPRVQSARARRAERRRNA